MALGDFFLRHISKKRQAPEGIIAPCAFELRRAELTLSLTFQSDRLKTDEDLRQYQEAKAIRPSGDLPGLCRVSYRNLVSDVDPPLEPELDKNPDDKVYGDLHYVTEPPDEEQRAVLAFHARNNGGLLRPFVRSR